MKTPITPGEILLEDYLRPLGISQNVMARAVGVPPRALMTRLKNFILLRLNMKI